MEFPPKIERIDMSEFHATGDHWPFTPYCRSFYGGGRHHLSLAWEYRWHDTLLRPWIKLRCATGHHRLSKVGRRTSDGGWVETVECFYCAAPMLWVDRV